MGGFPTYPLDYTGESLIRVNNLQANYCKVAKAIGKTS